MKPEKKGIIPQKTEVELIIPNYNPDKETYEEFLERFEKANIEYFKMLRISDDKFYK